MNTDILDIKTVHQCNSCLGCKTSYPQACVIRLDGGRADAGYKEIRFGFCTVLMIDHGDGKAECCGCRCYDFSEATMVFLSPGHAFDMEDGHALPGKGWLLAFDPGLLDGLPEQLDNYTFFHYRKNEALHLSLREKNKISGCLHELEEELRHPVDSHSETLISDYIKMILDYCRRYYERQFITRGDANKSIIKKTDCILEDFIMSGKLERKLFPTAGYCASLLDLSENYLNDLLKAETGKGFEDYFKLRLIGASKKMLLGKGLTTETIAKRLGFPNADSFRYAFEKITGTEPEKYLISRN